METLHRINTNTAYDKYLYPTIQEFKNNFKFIDNGKGNYANNRAVEFAKNNFIYTDEMEKNQEKIHHIIFEIFK